MGPMGVFLVLFILILCLASSIDKRNAEKRRLQQERENTEKLIEAIRQNNESK